jgi:quaternary ammonium compound-resistance protein SugE
LTGKKEHVNPYTGEQGVVLMAWISLLFAGLFEVGWPVGLKMAQQEHTRVAGIAVAIVCMATSGFLLWIAQKTIPMGTSYAIWTGIGAAGTFLVGVLCYGDAATLWRFVGVALIVAGVATLKIAH